MKLKTLFGTLVLASASLQASAQMTVIDPAVLGEAVKQVKSWTDQYQQMRTQIDAMNYQIKAMTGDRGMSHLLPSSEPALPANWGQSMSNLSALAQQIRQSQAVLQPDQASHLSPELQRFLAQAQNVSAANQAMTQAAFNDAALRQSRLNLLTATLAQTTEPKAAYDLANRIAIEHAELVKDQNQLEAAASGATAQDRAQRLMISQMRASAVGTNIPRIDTSLP
ncbi:type IV secretion system protein [Herbaspirillum sp. SJZ107]|uniref:type IV secretion system protein n=1 Tax=Herbaspirillum sp. SJZ107 TaxID=2572881 RepID=UPI00114D82B3|nr:type IV secretion system protein [Herbaspirillum sp. SJZ107]TQK07829.1 type IV secretion system VirB5/TraC/TraE/TrbJ family protein [Herbaspirillum sp. SJZ107]